MTALGAGEPGPSFFDTLFVQRKSGTGFDAMAAFRAFFRINTHFKNIGFIGEGLE